MTGGGSGGHLFPWLQFIRYRPVSPHGYGLYTTVDAKVDGRLAASTIALPQYDTVGNYPRRVHDSLGPLFDDPAWAGPRYTYGLTPHLAIIDFVRHAGRDCFGEAARESAAASVTDRAEQ